jgi:response regulator RpfG family c-di-GMP phosphodiesterase
MKEIPMNTLNSAEKATILVVDDTPDNLALMHNLLKWDYHVKIASNGEKALKIAASGLPPDLILLDIMMPDMDGYEVCRQLKRDPGTMDIPIIFITAKTDEEDERKGLELGAIDYITKPISPPIVMARVKNHLALRERSSREEIEARHDLLKKSLERFITQLEQKQPEELGRRAATVDPEKLMAVCDKLESLLAADDAEACEVMEANAELLDSAFPDNCHQIDNYIRSFNFEAALAVLKNIRAIHGLMNRPHGK